MHDAEITHFQDAGDSAKAKMIASEQGELKQTEFLEYWPRNMVVEQLEKILAAGRMAEATQQEVFQAIDAAINEGTYKRNSVWGARVSDEEWRKWGGQMSNRAQEEARHILVRILEVEDSGLWGAEIYDLHKELQALAEQIKANRVKVDQMETIASGQRSDLGHKGAMDFWEDEANRHRDAQSSTKDAPWRNPDGRYFLAEDRVKNQKQQIAHEKRQEGR